MPDHPPPRGLGAPAAAALVVSSMIGSGVFTTSGLLAADLGSPLAVLAVWAVAGLLALAGASTYAELGTLLPRAGGEYVYLSRAFHPAVGFLSGFVSLVAGFSAPIAAGALAFGRYLGAVVPGVNPQAAGAALIIAATALSSTGPRAAGRAHVALTSANLLLIVGLIVAALAAPAAEPARALAATAGLPRPGAFAVGLIYASYSYLGWNAAAYVAGELRDPARTLPRALLAGCGVVTALYVLLNAAFFAAAPPGALAGKVEIAHTAAAMLWGERAGAAVSALVCAALAAHVSAMVTTGPRVYTAMAEDGLFFRAFARRSAGGAPVASVWLQGALALAVMLTATFEELMLYIGLLLGLSTTLTVAAVFVLRGRLPEAARPHRAAFYPWAPAAFLALSLWMSVYAVIERPRESLAGLLTLVVGGGAYLLARIR
jgi:APA family basic amino acid/polyamine antiporter